jgi:hypothetical protein
MSWLSDFLNPGRAYDAAGNKMKKYYEQGKGYTQPYLDALKDPRQLQADWINSYEASPYANQTRDTAMQGGLNAASSMGLMGSSAALQAMQGGASNIMNADRQAYLNDLMNKYQMGAGMAQNAQQNEMNMGNQMGGLEFGRRQAGSNMIGQGLNLAGNWLTGGFGQGGFGRGMFQPNADYFGGRY